MAVELPGLMIGFLSAAADYSNDGVIGAPGGQFRFMDVAATADFTAIRCATQGQTSIGVLQNKPHLGEGCSIMGDGVSKVWASGVFAAGAQIAVAADGGAIAAAAGNVVVGRALEASTGPGIVVTVLLALAHV